MKPSQVAEAIGVLYRKRRPFFVWGAPGAGKSDVMRQKTKEEKLELRDIRLSMLDPTDLKGFPIADHEREVMRWLTADFLPKDPKWKGIIFFDEANSAPKSVEAPMYQLTLDRRWATTCYPMAAPHDGRQPGNRPRHRQPHVLRARQSPRAHRLRG
jgi:MoxR-like ATPase